MFLTSEQENSYLIILGTRSKIKKGNFENISKHTKQNFYMLTLNFT